MPTEIFKDKFHKDLLGNFHAHSNQQKSVPGEKNVAKFSSKTSATNALGTKNTLELCFPKTYNSVRERDVARLLLLPKTGDELLSSFSDLELQDSVVLSGDSDEFGVSCTAAPERPWIEVNQPEVKITAKITALSYNVLCDKYATTSQYGHCPDWALKWDYRKGRILDEILRHDADIISLQEVESREFETHFMPMLATEGYDGIFSAKSRAKTMCEKDKAFVDGCAVFWKTERFTIEREHVFDFRKLAVEHAEGSHSMLNRVMTRDNIALVAVLRTKTDGGTKGPPLVVCTAHVHWDPEFCDVKLIQSMMLIKELSSLLERIVELESKSSHPQTRSIQSPNDIPFLICGDLNSLPVSGVIEFISRGNISASHPELKEFKDDPCLNGLGHSSLLSEGGTMLQNSYFGHNLDVESAYNNDSLPFTNYTPEFKGVIDYMFSSRRTLIPLSALGSIPQSWFEDNNMAGCPNPHVPSDHIPLVVQYGLPDNTSDEESANQKPNIEHAKN